MWCLKALVKTSDNGGFLCARDALKFQNFEPFVDFSILCETPYGQFIAFQIYAKNIELLKIPKATHVFY